MDNENAQVAMLIVALGDSESGKMAILKAIAERHGIVMRRSGSSHPAKPQTVIDDTLLDTSEEQCVRSACTAPWRRPMPWRHLRRRRFS